MRLARGNTNSMPWWAVAIAGSAAALLVPATPVPQAAPAATNRSARPLPGLEAPVQVDFDHLGIPHIYARSAPDAYRALGYLHARDRLFQMEVYRRRGSGTLAEMLGPSQLDDDIFIRQLGLRRSAEAIWRSPRLNAAVRAEFQAYCDGVNARLAELGDAIPSAFRQLGLKPAPWTPVDALVFARYMAWDQSGTDTDVWMGMLVEKLGLDTVNELFPLDRPYEVPTVPASALAQPPAGGELPEAAGAARGRGETPPRFPSGFDQAARELHAHFAGQRFASPFAFGSNNWAIDGHKSATGKPILANDPHLGLSLPSIWYTAHLVAPGLDVIGVTFPGFPYAVIGHNERVAWGLTNLQSDQVDYFIEKTEVGHPGQYLYQGEWRPLERREEDIAVRGAKPYHLLVESTVHGPLVTVHGARLALDWTGLEPSFEVLSFRRMNRARNLADFHAALRDLAVPALNVIYADTDGNIAIAPHGRLPLRKRGLGRWPVDGASGDFDWLGFIPDDRLPFALNPPEHFLASANGRPTPVGYPYYLGWMWDPSYRTRRIHELLRTHQHISVADMERFQMDAHDAAAEAFVPVLVAAYDRRPFGGERVREAIHELRRWNFEARPDSVAETVWAAWFETFRQAVWQNHFDAAGVEPWTGGWGFAGSNERQPELEVLEFLTREVPDSPWFDDERTPVRESRDDVLRSSFAAAVEALTRQRGADMRQWFWGKTNVLRLHSLTGVAALDRGDIAVPGDEFTLGPGANGGEVTGGASWRMVVDLGDLENSAGMYPGGQSEDPASPHYDDQMKPWAEGHYLPLPFPGKPGTLPPGQTESVLVLTPEHP
ncbi:MAG TPA: penicillin acylase family protein [Terriglobia bacterium]|nr:penicillin acylase family protein [Terriglobia bacterium]